MTLPEKVDLVLAEVVGALASQENPTQIHIGRGPSLAGNDARFWHMESISISNHRGLVSNAVMCCAWKRCTRDLGLGPGEHRCDDAGILGTQVESCGSLAAML